MTHDEDAPLRLDDAVTKAFPHGGMTVAGLRREAARGRLSIWRIANKDFTSLSAIREMLEKCRVDRQDYNWVVRHHIPGNAHNGVISLACVRAGVNPSGHVQFVETR